MVRNTLHFVLLVPAVIGLMLTIFLAVMSSRSDVSEESFPRLATSAWGAIFGEIPAEMPGSFDDTPESDSLEKDKLPADVAETFARNNAFLCTCALLVLLGVVGIGIMGSAATIGEPLSFPLIRTAAISGIAVIGFLLWGFNLAYPGDFNGFIGFVGFSFPGDIDSVEYGMSGMSQWTDLFYIATYAAMFGALIVSFCSARIKCTAAMLIAVPTTVILLPIVISWHWGGGWLSGQGAYDFAGAGLFHWHVGVIALVISGFSAMFSRQPENRALMEEDRSLKHPALYLAGLACYFLLMVGMNAGSVLAATPDMVATIIQATVLAGVVSAALSVVWWTIFRTRSVIQFAGYGLISGAVIVSGAPDSLSLTMALVLGVASGMWVPATIVGMDKLRFPDPLAVGPVHGIAGFLGIIITLFVKIQDIEASVAAQILTLICVPLLSLVLTVMTMVVAGTSNLLFVPREETKPAQG